MGNAVFPSLAGIGWNIHRRTMFNNSRPRAVSGREVAFSYQVYPLYEFELNYEFLRAGSQVELQTIAGFFESRQGSFDSFLFTDWLDNGVTDMQFGTGDGTTTQFQLTRAFGAGGFTYAAPVQNVNTLTNIKKAGVTQTLTTHYTISATGLVTFVTAPAAAAALTWSGTFYYRCRFKDDIMDLQNFMYQLWDLGQVVLIGATGNRV